jgi:beta-galactosidase
MNTYGCTPDYLTKNETPWFPVMGEMHFSRYPAEYWKESLLKMKAGGVDIVSTYVIWIHHEEIEKHYDFTGQRDLRRFVETCADCDISLMLRLGPWSHGEVRNGGFPDWLLGKNFTLRSNDPEYLKMVERFYERLFAEAQGFLLKDNGPIIGVQIENEYGHCGGLQGKEGESHMKTLASIAKKVGFDVPLMTATGWGGAVTGGLIPVMGGYCEAPWDKRLTDIEPSGNYIITHERNDHNIGSDFGFGRGITFDLRKFPFLTAELGGGLQVTKHRRPIATASDIGAMSLVKLASGVNLLGYYMYHGGTNPEGKLTTLQETKATGSPNDLPELSYDFRAPIREYGQISDTYRELKLLTSFLHDFGSSLCGMKAIIPESNPRKPANQTEIRHSFRTDGKSGYLFVNNYQRRQDQAPHAGINFVTPEGTSFPSINIENREYFFLPYNMPIGDAILETALVTPLCVLLQEKPVYVFYAAFAQAETLLAEGNLDGLYFFKGGKKPTTAEIRTLSRNEALHAWKVGETLIISKSDLEIEGVAATALSRTSGPRVTARRIASVDEKTVYEISVGPWEGNDCFLRIDYEGDSARLYEEGKLRADNFFIGSEYAWEIGLKRFGKGKTHVYTLEIDALTEGTPLFLEKWPILENGKACRLIEASAEIEIKG